MSLREQHLATERVLLLCCHIYKVIRPGSITAPHIVHARRSKPPLLVPIQLLQAQILHSTSESFTNFSKKETKWLLKYQILLIVMLKIVFIISKINAMHLP